MQQFKELISGAVGAAHTWSLIAEALNPLTRLKPDSVTEFSDAGLDASLEIARGSKLILRGNRSWKE